MLSLQYVAQEPTANAPQSVPISEVAALGFERALLANDRATRRRELENLFSTDPNVAGWALRTAEMRVRRTINRLEEAAEWLSDSLEKELAAALAADESSPGEITWRLPALVARLCICQARENEFRDRLEHEKLESLKELAYGASHEINNPLANIAARAQTLLTDETDSERRRKLVAIHRQAMRAHEMIADLMLFARPPKLNPTPCDCRQLVRRVVKELAELAQEYNVRLDCESDVNPIECLADDTQLGVAIQAVVKNAIEAAGDGGHVEIIARERLAGPDRWAEIAVRDSGPGISDEVRQHIFDPFYSGREAGRGLGFGLSKCWRIVTDHGGQVVVEKSEIGGAEVIIRLPLRALAH
jgi:signal transduction histidine kinase